LDLVIANRDDATLRGGFPPPEVLMFFDQFVEGMKLHIP
jgi:hypothetical protein